MKQTVNRWLAWTGIACLLLCGVERLAGASSKDPLKNRVLADALFTNSGLLHLRLEIPKPGVDSLRRDARKYVKATLWEGDQVFHEVGVHLKGSAGSFRQVDEKPGLTVNMTAFRPNPRFHGLKKFHLNNSVQDPSYLSEMICGEMFRAAGVPAPRVTHALVELNGRKQGLYVLMESMDRDFLARDFQNTKGNVYGQAGGCEITDEIQRMDGAGPLDRADLKALAAAVQEPDTERRWERVQQTLDVDRFLSFMALEVMFTHWDGYTFARHNYRVYHDLDTGRMVFLPHDLDQMFRDFNGPIVPGVNGLVAQAMLRMPETRRRYLARFGTIFTNLYVVPTLTSRINERVAQLLPLLKAADANLARDFQNNANELKSRLVNRAQWLEKQLPLAETKPLKFDNDVAKLGEWRRENEMGGARLEPVKDSEGKRTLWIGATGRTTSSWRKRVLLAGGRYRFEGLARAAGINPLREEKKGEGAGLRISGNQQARANKLVGDSPWQKLAYEFDVVSPDDEVDLVCELRANKGEVWFDLDSLRLVRAK